MDRREEVDGSVTADAAFHATIARATGNAYFERFTALPGVRLVPSRKLYLLPAMHGAYARTINEDQAIYAAIAASDPSRSVHKPVCT